MNEHDWIKQFPAAVTVCDCNGVILAMNDKAAQTFEKDGGYDLIGKNLLDCHPEPARSKTQRLLEACEKNVYTIEKNGVKKLIYQSPWFEDGHYAGFVELSLEIPFEMEHFVRSEEGLRTNMKRLSRIAWVLPIGLDYLFFMSSVLPAPTNIATPFTTKPPTLTPRKLEGGSPIQ
jgi:transcriptional regulator with PAS, ATPase and Fis domain